MKQSITIGSAELSNPVLTASGTFGYGLEFQEFFEYFFQGLQTADQGHRCLFVRYLQMPIFFHEQYEGKD